MQREKILWTVKVSLMAAVVVVLANTPLGMIQLPVIKATTVHIPVILGAILFGPLAGAILGGVFGICSMVSNTVAPTLLSFAFSPFLTTSGIAGILKSVWVAFFCRVLLGILAAYLWKIFGFLGNRLTLRLTVVGFLSSVLHTLLVMGSIYLLFMEQYAAVKEVAVSAVFGLIMVTVFSSGVPEALLAALLSAAIGRVLFQVMRSVFS